MAHSRFGKMKKGKNKIGVSAPDHVHQDGERKINSLIKIIIMMPTKQYEDQRGGGGGGGGRGSREQQQHKAARTLMRMRKLHVTVLINISRGREYLSC